MSKRKSVFKPVGKSEDFNRPSETIAYISRMVSKEMSEAFRQFRLPANKVK